MARQMGATYVECSSKEMSGVHEVFELAVDTAVGREIHLREESDARQKYNRGEGGVIGGRVGKTGKLKKKRGCPVL